jgi:3-keto-disaccharide hydrolase/FG-GAP-like repeat
MMSRRLLGLVATFAALLTVPVAGTRSMFVPDWTFKGSTLTGWHVVGAADWKAADGELVGTPKSADGGWLVLDKSFQDVEFGADYKCVGECRTGVLLRAEKTPTGMKGVFLSLDSGEVGGYAVTLDAHGKILTRERLRPGGGLMRIAPSAAEQAAAAAARGAGAGRGAGRGGNAGLNQDRRMLPSGATLPDVVEPSALKPNDWNDVDVVIDANIFRPWVNTSGSGGGAADDDLGAFGPIAIYVGGSGEVHFRDVSYRDLSLKRIVPEQLSTSFRILRLTPFYYSFASGAADFDRDGNMDIVSGPFIFMGPDFTKVREFYMALSTNPSTSFSPNWLEFAGDFTGDGWPDVLLASTSNTRLYVNPKGEPRRWDSILGVVPPAPNVSEVSVMKDIDADGKPDLIYASAGAMRWAKPDPANPTGPWLSTQVGEDGTYAAHGIGAGDINGDGRVDILNVFGWWEQPEKATTGMWPYHPQAFGRQNGRGAPGGAEMCVYDVNGDKLNDVVTSIQAHVFGLAWFEQKRDASGKVSFEKHMISDDFASKNAGGVTFSEPHGSACADMNGDGVPDFVIGKRFFSHNESTTDPDPYGAAVLYVYRTVRNKQAPGGAEFVPELVHNQSGAGSQVLAVDLNKDGVMDLVTSGELGAFAFLGQPRAKK